MNIPKKISNLSKANKFAQIEYISIIGITERMGPIGLHVYADAYLSAARSLPKPTVPFEPVRPFLVCHSIELSLKAFLSLQGAAMIELADGSVCHNLESILQKTESKNIDSFVALTRMHKAEIRNASLYYAGKVFEYPAVGEAFSAYPSMPAIEILLEVATLLVDSLHQPCLNAK